MSNNFPLQMLYKVKHIFELQSVTGGLWKGYFALRLSEASLCPWRSDYHVRTSKYLGKSIQAAGQRQLSMSHNFPHLRTDSHVGIEVVVY